MGSKSTTDIVLQAEYISNLKLSSCFIYFKFIYLLRDLFSSDNKSQSLYIRKLTNVKMYSLFIRLLHPMIVLKSTTEPSKVETECQSCLTYVQL